jgi:hypothetical protein
MGSLLPIIYLFFIPILKTEQIKIFFDEHSMAMEVWS